MVYQVTIKVKTNLNHPFISKDYVIQFSQLEPDLHLIIRNDHLNQ